MIEELVAYQHCVSSIHDKWPEFLEKRRERLVQQDRYGAAAEKVAENILEDLFTGVLDWRLSDVNYQVEYADLLLTALGIKYLLVEVKRPGMLAWNRKAIESALEQARRYADEQKVRCVSVSDGTMLYAADIRHGGIEDRVFVSLESPEPPDALWWLSVHGIYRDRVAAGDAALRLLPDTPVPDAQLASEGGAGLLHPKYHLPAHCFAYVGNAGDPHTWHLPYLRKDRTPDSKRLPKAIQAVISNYRGAKVSSIPEQHIPAVLFRLASAAVREGKMPFQGGRTSETYEHLEAILDQLERLEDLKRGRQSGLA
jgi:hypothetical protein